MPQQTPLYIIASPRTRVGKTLIARLLIEFFRASDRPLFAYDLDPRDPALTGHFPHLVSTVDITDTLGQMALFDRLIAGAPRTTIIDLGYAPYDKFFGIMTEIGFVQEARRRQIEPIILFMTDSASATMRAYAELRRRLEKTTFVPVHNEFVSVMFSTQDYPPTRPEYGSIRIPRLSPIVRGVIDRPSFSFGEYLTERPGGPTEIHGWISSIFAEFRELELRLLMGKLSASLGGGAAKRPREVRRAH